MDAYKVNPPLPKMIAALPLLMDRPPLAWYQYGSPLIRLEFQFAYDWFRRIDISFRRQLVLARCMMLVFVAIGAWSLFRWTSALYGRDAALAATAAWMLNPDVLTYSAVVSPDLPASAAGLLMGFTFWKWLRSESRAVPWSVAATVAFAVLCKFSWLFLIPFLPLVTLLHDVSRIRRRSHASDVLDASGRRTYLRSAASCLRGPSTLALSFSLTLFLINYSYGFDASGTKLGEFRFISEPLAGPGLASHQHGNRFSGSVLGELPVPLPEQMVLGLDYLSWEFETGMTCYVRGQWQHRGWWWFHVYAMAVKIPTGFWILFFIGLGSLLVDFFRGEGRVELEWLPLIIALAFITLISSQTGFTHHVRYVLPAYGLMSVTAARAIVVCRAPFARAACLICLAGVIPFHLSSPGLTHTYFNALAGGPENGWRHLGRSNVDWGQSTFRMIDWIRSHPDVRPLNVAMTEPVGGPGRLLEGLGDVAAWAPSGDAGQKPAPGWYLLSSEQMTVERNKSFRGLTPLRQPYPDVLLFRVQ